MTENEIVARIVGKFFKSRFPEVDLVDVQVQHDFDNDDRPFFNIEIIYDAPEAGLDVDKLLPMVRLIKPQLVERNLWDAGFPVLSYVWKRDREALSA